MSRSRAHSLVALVLFVCGLALLAAACGSASPEQQLLTNFFRAARVRDNTTLANIAAVTFNPRTEGTVEDFEVVTVGPEQRRPVQIRALLDEEAKAQGRRGSLRAPAGRVPGREPGRHQPGREGRERASAGARRRRGGAGLAHQVARRAGAALTQAVGRAHATGARAQPGGEQPDAAGSARRGRLEHERGACQQRGDRERTGADT